MTTENPFTDSPLVKEVKFYLVELSPWEWVKTEDLDNEDKPAYYDHSNEGRLFSSSSTCPDCGCKSLRVSAGKIWGEIQVKDIVCMTCDNVFKIESEHGEGILIPTDERDDQQCFLPSHIVISC